MDTLVEYYSQRAPEYEEIYHRDDPVRQRELAEIGDMIRETFAGQRVLEVACGTGFWTKILLEVAEEVVATDASATMLDFARQKLGASPKIRFQQADAYDLANVPTECDAALANFWLSHVPRRRLRAFLEQFHRRLGVRAVVLMADNMNVPGVGGEFVRSPGMEDTYKLRSLSDGSTHRIVKNYFNEAELREIFSGHTSELEIHCGHAYWWIRYRVPGPN